MSDHVRNSIAYLKRVESRLSPGTVQPGEYLSLEAGEDQALPARLFSHEMAVFYVYDDGSNFTYVTEAMRDDAGLDAAELDEIGLRNLSTRFRDMTINQAGDLFVFAGDSNFEASMVLLAPLWDQLAQHFPNGPVAAMPARDVLGLCDAGSESIDKLRSTAKHLWDTNAAHLLARDLYIRGSDREWRVLPE